MFVAFFCFLQVELPGYICGSSVIRTFIFVLFLDMPFYLFIFWSRLYTLLWDITGFSFLLCASYHKQCYQSGHSQKSPSESGSSINSVSSLFSLSLCIWSHICIMHCLWELTQIGTLGTNNIQRNVCLFTKKLGFKIIFEGPNWHLLDLQCNRTKVGNLTHMAKIVRGMYRSCQNCMEHFETTKVIFSRQKAGVENKKYV